MGPAETAAPCSPAVWALYVEICTHLVAGTEHGVMEAARLCGLIPAESLTDDPVIVPAVMTVGARLESLGKMDPAALLFDRIRLTERAVADDRANAALHLALIRLASDRRDDALELLRQSLKLAGSPPIILAASGSAVVLLQERAEWEEALAIARRARATVVDNPALALFFDLRTVQSSAQLRELPDTDDASLVLPEHANALDPSSSADWMNAAFALELCGYPGQARAFYERLLKLKELPTGMRTNLHYRLGLVLDRLLDFEGAERHLHAAVHSTDPFPAAQSEARLRLAQLRFLMDDFDAALPDFDFLRTEGTSVRIRSEAQLRYGTCLLRSDRPEEARVELLRCRTDGFGGDTEFEVKADLLLAEIAEASGDFRESTDCYERIVHHPLSEPLTRAAALTRLQQVRRMQR